MDMNIIIDAVQWHLGEREYSDYELFVQDVVAYNKMLFPEFSWEHKAVALKENKVTIFHESKEVNGGKYLDLELSSNNKQHFTEGELLFKINNNSIGFFQDKALKYFEGVFIKEEDEEGITLGLKLTE